MDKNCTICLKIVRNPESTIWQLQIEEKPVFVVIQELFALRINVANRRERKLPYKVCPACFKNLTTAYELRSQLRKTLEVITFWDKNHEPGEVYYGDDQYKEEPEQEVEVKMEFQYPPLDIKEEVIADSDSERTVSQDSYDPDGVSDLEQKPFGDCDEPFETKHGTSQEQSVLCNDNSNSEKFICDICGKTFKLRLYIWRHLRDIHFNNRQFECKVCLKIFKTARNLKSHLVVHTDERRFSCKICSKTFKHRNILRTHMRLVHLNVRPYECKICHKRFKVPYSLRYHQRVHAEERQFSCDICSKTFQYRHLLNTHLRQVHPNDTPYECEICCKTFKTTMNLKCHQNVHTQERPFECAICSNTFRAKKEIVVHMRAVHIENKVFCYICRQSFKSGKRFNYHKWYHHSTSKNIKCEVCQKTFKTSAFLKRHEKLHR